MKNVYLFLLCIVVSMSSFAQGNGVSFSDNNKCINRTFSVSVHILLDSMDQENVTEVDIATGLTLANKHFAKRCIKFQICSTYVHPNVRNDTLVPNVDDREIAAMYDVPNTINLYYVRCINPRRCETHGLSPIATTPPVVPLKTPSRDAIFIQKKYAQGYALTKFLGRYFGLADITSGYSSNEFNIKASNCCNIMYYPNSLCDTPDFNAKQFDIMIDVMKKGRNYLW